MVKLETQCKAGVRKTMVRLDIISVCCINLKCNFKGPAKIQVNSPQKFLQKHSKEPRLPESKWYVILFIAFKFLIHRPHQIFGITHAQYVVF